MLSYRQMIIHSAVTDNDVISNLKLHVIESLLYSIKQFQRPWFSERILKTIILISYKVF